MMSFDVKKIIFTWKNPKNLRLGGFQGLYHFQKPEKLRFLQMVRKAEIFAPEAEIFSPSKYMIKPGFLQFFWGVKLADTFKLVILADNFPKISDFSW